MMPRLDTELFRLWEHHSLLFIYIGDFPSFLQKNPSDRTMQKWTHVVELSHVGTRTRKEKFEKKDTKTRLSSLTRKDFFSQTRFKFLTTTFFYFLLRDWQFFPSSHGFEDGLRRCERVLPSTDGFVYCLCNRCDWLIWFL